MCSSNVSNSLMRLIVLSSVSFTKIGHFCETKRNLLYYLIWLLVSIDSDFFIIDFELGKSIVLSSIYLSIYGIYIALLQGNYSEALPAQARAKIKVLNEYGCNSVHL